MPLTSEVQSAVSLLENLQGSLRGLDEPRLGVQYTNDLNTLISVLHNPVLNKIIAIQDSLHDLKTELARHPSLLPSDFDISPRRGELTLHFPSGGVEEGGEIYPKRKSSKASAELVQSSSREILDSDKSLQNSYDAHPLEEPDPSSPQRQWLKNGRGPDGDSEGELINHEHMDEDLDGLTDMPPLISNATFDAELSQLIRVAAEGREIHHIQMYKPEGTSLGFSVVGLKSENRGSLGIYVQEIQSTGIAAKDGRLREGDQILAIDGHILDSFMSHQQAIGILQKANKLVDLVIARAPIVDPLVSEQQQLEAFQRQKSLEQQQLESILIKDRDQLFVQQHQFTTTHIVPPSVESRTSNMLNTEWAQVEVIHLVNDGSGLGFGIIGGRSTGVVVKTILPGGVADREGRLQSGDHILQIGEVNLRGMGSDQVASVLRQAGSHVRLVVARPVESASPDFQIGKEAPIVETRVLNDPEELDRHLTLISNGFPSSSTIALASLPGGNGGGPASSSTSSASTVPAGVPTNGHCDYINGDSELLTMNNQIASTSAAVAVVASEGHLTSAGGGGAFMAMESIGPCDDETIVEGGEGMSLADLPEMENIDLDLAKDHQGLGITIAGYVCEREELSGIFVKSINAGSSADRSGQIRVNDQIVEVDGKSLTGLSNHAAVEVLRSTGQRVRLRLARYLRGPKFEQLQQAIANSELKTHPSTPNPPRAPHCGEVPSSEAIRTALGELEAENTSRSRESLVEAYNPSLAPSIPSHPPSAAQNTSVSSNKESYEQIHAKGISTVDVVQGTTSKPSNDVRLEDIELLIDTDYAGELRPSVENAIVRKWSRIVGPDFDIVVAQLRKFERGGGLGISLEGTVDVEDGREVRPHHYIRSILPDGPVGRDGRLRSGDELLEVNNQKLLGLNHVEVVTILKDLPQAVRIVCGRRVSGSTTPIHSGDVAQRESFGDRNVLGGSLQSLIPSSERLVKAKSDGSLASSTTNANSDSNSFTKVKSRSLEPLTGLAMWSTEPQHIELIKGERGLGFSILDYQDPMNPQETVIVIRSLVPGGVAEKDGRLIPGDRLVGVNGTSLEKASLDEAVAELKGAPKGPVIISVAKPISVLESPGQLDMILGDLGSSEGGSDVTEEVVDWKCEEEEDNRFQGQLEERRKRRKTNDSVISTSSVPPDLPYSDPPPMLDRDASVMMVPVATERLIGGSSSSSAANSAAPSSGEEDMSPHPSPVPQPRIHSLGLALPKHLERTVRIQKGGDQLGINIQVVDQGVNGVVVSSVVRGGAVHKDGRIRAGDLIVSVNNESMRNISNSQARGILRRTQLVTSDVSIVFIPGEDAAKHRESRLQSFKPDIVQTAQEQRHPYTNRESSDEERLGLSTDLTRSSTAPSFVTRQLRSRDTSQEEQTETHLPELQISSSDIHFVEARPSSSLSDVSGAAATVVTLKNAISEVLGTEERPRPSQKSGRDDSEEGPFTITFRNVTEAGLVRGDLQPLSDESHRAPSGLGGGVADSELRTAQFEPVQLTDVLYNQFLSSTNTSSCLSTIYTSSTVPNITPSEAIPSVRFVRFSDNKVGTELSGSSDSSLVVECGDSDKHSGSDIYFVDENYSENYTGAKLVVAHITDVESLVHKRALSSSRSFEEHLLSKDKRNSRLHKQQSEVVPSYYDQDTLKGIQRPQQARQEAFRKRLLYSEDPKHLSETVYLDSYEVDQNYPHITTTTTTTISSSSSLTGVQLAPSNISSSSSIRQENIEMTVSQGMNEAAPVETRSISSATPPAMDGKHWGPERVVEVKRDENGSLGISIVGGKVDVSWSGSSVTGIFVKNVLANSPAGRSGLLKTGDRILEVEGVDLRTASHEKAVEVIKKTGNPVTFVVQSLVQWNTASTPVCRESCRLEINAPDTIQPARTPTPELIQPGLSDQKKQKLQEKSREILAQKQETGPHVAALRRSLDKEEEGDEEESSDEEDFRALQGRTTNSKGVEIDRASAGALKRSKTERLADTEEDQFGYTQKKVQKKYSSPDGEVHLIELQKGSSGSGLGISLAGHKDRKQMSVYVCGMNPTGNAYKDGRIQVGDEILEVNGYVVEGRSHLNASTIFKGIPGPSIKIIVRRRKTGLQDMAVKPLTHFPVTLEDESPEEKYARFKGLKKFVMKKGQYGLGIMIIEGKHAEYGNGIFISDLQEGSIAAEAGLMVGDMILLVNKEEMIGIDYEMAASILKKTEGVITMWVANAARVTATTPTTDSANIGTKTGPPTPAKNTEPKKPEIPPKPSVLPKPPIPAKPLSIHSSQSVITNHPETSTTNTTTSSHSNPASTSSTPNLPNPDGTISTTSTRSSSLTTALHSSGSLRTSVTSSATSSEEPPEDPSACEVKRGRESTIEIVREKMGLGLSIVGGTDTLLGSIVIHEIYPEGAVAKDGRLRSGDQILEVNNEDFRTIVHQKALNALRQTPSKVKFVVYREDGSQKEEDLFDIINVQLTKKSGKGLGLSIVGRKNGTGVFISDLVPGGVAESDGRLMQGDQIFEVNDKNLRSASQEHAAAILKCAPASVNIKIGRLKPGKRIPHNLHPTWPVTIIEGPSRTPSSLSPEFPFPQPPLLISPHTIPQLQPPSPTSQSPPSPPIAIAQTVPPFRTVVLERGDDGLGFSIVGGFGSNLGDLPVYVKCIFDRGAAAREGSLRRGDQILQVNGRPLAGLTHVQAVGILKEAKGTVTLTIVPSK